MADDQYGRSRIDHAELSKPINNRLRLEAWEIEGLAKNLDGKRR